jgi:plasmid stability protein
MPATLVLDVEEGVLARLRERASAHGRTPEAEARLILQAALKPPVAWDAVNALRERLASSGRRFGDSADLLREDRDR